MLILPVSTKYYPCANTVVAVMAAVVFGFVIEQAASLKMSCMLAAAPLADEKDSGL